MKIEKGKLVELEYSLFLDGPDGELVEETTDDLPFTFVFKVEAMIGRFEEELEGKEPGDKFSFEVPCAEAYGEESEDFIVEFPKSAFLVDGELDEEAIAEGEVVPMTDEEGNMLEGVVVENKLNSVIIDFNHPLSGEDLYFDGKVLDVREPTEAEWPHLNGASQN
ncbi:FKBP-type peptidyl-prolyl cis-trans isomerase [Halocola ammonii]